jgi:hypothetical protein
VLLFTFAETNLNIFNAYRSFILQYKNTSVLVQNFWG